MGQTGIGGFVIVGEADDLPPAEAILSGGGGAGMPPDFDDSDMPPDFDAEPVENFEPKIPPAAAAATAGDATTTTVGDDDMD